MYPQLEFAPAHGAEKGLSEAGQTSCCRSSSRASFTRSRELRTESSIDFQRDRLVLVNAGIIDGVRNVVVYANIGHSVFSDDGGHFYAGGGFKVVIGR